MTDLEVYIALTWGSLSYHGICLQNMFRAVLLGGPMAASVDRELDGETNTLN